ATVGGNGLWGLQFDPDGNLYAPKRTTNTIYKFDPSGNPATFASSPTANLNAPEFIATQLLSPTTACIQFTTPSYNVNETAGSITIYVTRNGDTSGSATVHYATADGTAVAPADYNSASGDLTFNPG